MGKLIEVSDRFIKAGRKFVSPDGYDLCVICGSKTEFRHSTPVDERIGYGEAGQLCPQCLVDSMEGG